MIHAKSGHCESEEARLNLDDDDISFLENEGVAILETTMAAYLERMPQIMKAAVEIATMATQDDFSQRLAHAILAGVPPRVTTDAVKALQKSFGKGLAKTLKVTIPKRLTASLTNAVTPAVIAFAAPIVARKTEEHLHSILSVEVPSLLVEKHQLTKKVVDLVGETVTKDATKTVTHALSATLVVSLTPGMTRESSYYGNYYSAFYADHYGSYYSEYYSKAASDVRKKAKKPKEVMKSQWRTIEDEIHQRGWSP
mmetsp:Transcript_18052/g.34233  ORF Transcript_18052/g.34233 Transcript_18052/m.34233 type:complete len:254 (-) Transcript_18052:281-1042(-)|eukprot:CAMPEP_0170177114 /NCGR_PEP_ID=MMETSP0040_2-20121228/9837_1 /TAXON_ID=641309 /ORGANISM="Lotharella oceanica, Strain CCMP622" /LENGTH=253 /DNA_ID=CAMNT_0010419647 /DNA_START=571 /DNA_END=1332 /DNA_ORIENTATION=+